MRFSLHALLASLAVLAAPLFASPAAAWDRTSRLCEDPGVLHRVSEKFRYQVNHVPHLPDVAITDFRRVYETRYIPFSEDHQVARRYCGATAVLSDGRKRPVWYLIEDGMRFVGFGDNVEFCVSGFDRWNVYNGRCRILR